MKTHICSVWIVSDYKYGILYSCATEKMALEWYNHFGEVGGMGVTISELKGNVKRSKKDGHGYESKKQRDEWVKK